MLTLPIKAKWYNMILSGEKQEEYRGHTHYYNVRFFKHRGKTVNVRFRNGYRADSPTLEALVRPMLRKGAKLEWGGDPDKACWVLEILAVRDVTEHGPAQV